MLNIYEFDEEGRAKLKEEYKNRVKMFSRNVLRANRSYMFRKLKLTRKKYDNRERVADALDKYYVEQGAVWFEFENNPDRLVRNQSLDKNIFFLHQMSVFPDEYSFSRFRNREEGITFSDMAFLNVALEPALSASFKKYNSKSIFGIAHQKNGVGGLILGGGRIAMAFGHDIGSFFSDFDVKSPDSGREVIHEDIEDRMTRISQLKKHVNKYKHNEVILNHPKVCGVFLYAGTFNKKIKEERIRIAQETAQKIGVPLFRINKEGNIRIMGENENLALEDVLSHTLNLTQEKRQQILQEELIESGHFNEMDIARFTKRINRLEIDNNRIISDAKRLFERKGFDLQEINRIVRENEISEKDFWNLISLQMNSGKKAKIEDLFEVVNGKMEARQSFMDEIERFKKGLSS